MQLKRPYFTVKFTNQFIAPKLDVGKLVGATKLGSREDIGGCELCGDTNTGLRILVRGTRVEAVV